MKHSYNKETLTIEAERLRSYANSLKKINFPEALHLAQQAIILYSTAGEHKQAKELICEYGAEQVTQEYFIESLPAQALKQAKAILLEERVK